MAGTKIGALKARATNIKLYGPSFYKNIGRKGGTISRGGGFTNNPELAKIAGSKGGSVTLEGRHGRYAKNK